MAIDYIENMQQHKTSPEMTWSKLFHATRALSVPFQLVLSNRDGVVYCEEIVRVIPKKRLVAFGDWEGNSIAAKLFFEPGNAKRHCRRELLGIEILIAAGIPTPKMLYQGSTQKNLIQILLLEKIDDARNLDDIWQEKTSPQELALLMQAVTIELATQHVLGVMQRDLHLKNFLVKGNQIYTLDGAGISCIHEPLAKKPSLDNLALFFAQLGVGTEQLQQELFQVYTKARGWLVKQADIDFLQAAIKRWNMQRRLQYQEKIKRNSSAFAKTTKANTIIMYDRNYRGTDFVNFLMHPESIFNQAETLKTGRSSTVIKASFDHHIVVIKRYNIKNIWHGLRRCLRSTRAAKSWRVAHLLRLFGVATAQPIAYIEKHFLGLRGKSYFVMKYVDGKHLGDYFADYDMHDARFAKIAVRVVTLLKNLAKLRMSHGDLKVTNIIIEHERPVLIDLDGVVEHRSDREANRAYKNEIKRFMKNWETQPRVHALFEKLLQD